MHGQWININDSPPGAADFDAYGKVLLWDVNNGCMVGKRSNECDIYRDPVTHWQRTPNAWITMAERHPGVYDCDMCGCVLTMSASAGALILGIHNATLRLPDIIAWQRLPEGPKEPKGGSNEAK